MASIGSSGPSAATPAPESKNSPSEAGTVYRATNTLVKQGLLKERPARDARKSQYAVADTGGEDPGRGEHSPAPETRVVVAHGDSPSSSGGRRSSRLFII
jgi:hypothetical protein